MAKFLDLEQFGLDPDNVDAEFTGVEKILVEWAYKAIDEFRNNLTKNGSNSTYGLAQGIVPLPVKRFGKGYAIEIEGPSHWKYVEYGVRGRFGSRKAPDSPFQFKDKFPPRDVFKKWMSTKGIKPRNNQSIDDKAREIQHGVCKYGIKKNPFISPFVTDAEITRLAEQVADYISKNKQ